MKIKFWLVIVGGGFSYCLLQLQLRYYPHDTQDHNLQLQVQNEVIIQIDDLESHMSQEADAHVDSTLATSPEEANRHFGRSKSTSTCIFPQCVHVNGRPKSEPNVFSGLRRSYFEYLCSRFEVIYEKSGKKWRLFIRKA